MLFYGYQFSKRTENDINGAPAIIYSYIPNKQDKILKNTESVSKYLYHICPEYVLDKIKKTGLIPKSKNTLYKYEPRVHLCVSNTPYEELRFITYQLDFHNKSKINKHKYYLLKIDISKISCDLYKDLDYEYGLYTNEPISKDAIILKNENNKNEIKHIEPFTIEEFRNYSFVRPIKILEI